MNTPKNKPAAAMASITERLARDEWNPQPGDILTGTIAEITARSITTKDEDHREILFPVITVDPGGGQPAVTVDCLSGWLRDPVIAARPKRGQQIGFRFIGPVTNDKTGKTSDKWAVAFEDDEVPEPDWAKMAGNRDGAWSRDTSPPAPEEPAPDEPAYEEPLPDDEPPY